MKFGIAFIHLTKNALNYVNMIVAFINLQGDSKQLENSKQFCIIKKTFFHRRLIDLKTVVLYPLLTMVYMYNELYQKDKE